MRYRMGGLVGRCVVGLLVGGLVCVLGCQLAIGGQKPLVCASRPNPTKHTKPNHKHKHNNSGIAEACGFLTGADDDCLFLPFSNPAANVTEPPVFPTIIAREQLSRASAMGKGVGQREPDSIGYVVKNCQKMGKCRDISFMRQQLGPKMPELKVYQCDVKTGRATPFVYKPTSADMELRQRAEGGGNV